MTDTEKMHQDFLESFTELLRKYKANYDLLDDSALLFFNSADQARELGLKVGDTIQSLEKTDDGWHELQMTLVWLGTLNTDWIVSEAVDRLRPWSSPYAAANWCLSGRNWERVETPPEHATFMDDVLN